MSNALIIYERMNELQTAAGALHASGYFSDVKTQQQAMVKVMAGAEIGLPPFASMTGIHIVQGKPVIGANLIATLVKNDPRYDYRIARADHAACIIEWHEGGRMVGQSSFTMEEAAAAGLSGKDNWKKYPSDMLFARAISRGARRYAPGIFGGSPVYTPDEMGVETDEDGVIIPGEIVQAPPAQPTNGKPAAQPAAAPVDNGPLPDDEQAVYDAPGAEFVPKVAEYLHTDEANVKAHMKRLGHNKIPGIPKERLAIYRQLRGLAERDAIDNLDDGNGNTGGAIGFPLFLELPPADEDNAAQPPLVTDDPDAAQAAKETAQGLFD